MTIETILEIIEGKKSIPLAKTLLNLMSQCYRAAITVRHFAYDKMISSTKLSLPVISVGNIVSGGTGKTPFVHYLTKALGSNKVAILSRGYKRRSNKTLLVKETTSFDACGDEPYMLAKKLPEARIIVGANRVIAGHLAENLGAQYIILDDGMQHRQLHRDVEIGVMDADDLFGKGYYLPRGFLRDHPKRLELANLIILNRVKDEEHFDKLTTLIRRYSSAPITAMNLNVENSTALASKKIACFCAIAAPGRFINTVKNLGCDVVLKEEKLDHNTFAIGELERLANQARNKGAECLVCTEKDAVKLPNKLALSLPVIPLKISLTPTFGKEHLEKMIQEVQQ